MESYLKKAVIRRIYSSAGRDGGSAVFLILIAVVLFAALSYAVTQTSRGGGDIMNEEKYLSAARISEIGAGMQAAVMRMVVSGTAVDAITLHAAANTWTVCTTGADCLFAHEGGAVPPPILPPDQYIEKGVYGGGPPVLHVYEIADGAAVAGVNGGNPVLLMTVRMINNKICTDINRGLGLSGLPTVLWASVEAGQITSSFSGARAGCVGTTGLAGDNTYYHVLGY